MSREFKAPSRADVTIIKVSPENIKTHHHYIDETASRKSDNWYPASTVKFVPAILAAKRLSESGFEDPDNLQITFHYAQGVQVRSWTDLIDKALRPSKNIPYNELVILAGHKNINEFLIQHSFDIALNKPYTKKAWKQLTGLNPATLPDDNHTFKGCRITVKNTQTSKTVIYDAARPGAYRLDTTRSSSCSTLGLAEFLCDFFFFNSKFKLHAAFESSIENKMKERKSVGMENFVDAIMGQIPSSEYEVYHKPGYLNGITELDGLFVYWCDTIVLKSLNKANSYAICAYGGEKKKILAGIGKNTKVEKQSMLNSNYYTNTQLGISEAIGTLIKGGDI